MIYVLEAATAAGIAAAEALGSEAGPRAGPEAIPGGLGTSGRGKGDPNTLGGEGEADPPRRPRGCRFASTFSLLAPAGGLGPRLSPGRSGMGRASRAGVEAGLGGCCGRGPGGGARGGGRGPAPRWEAGHVTPAAPAGPPGGERRGGPRRRRRARKPGPRGTGRRGPGTAAPGTPMPWRSWRPGWRACAGAWAPSRSTSSSAAAACPRLPASGQVPGVLGRATGGPGGHRGLPRGREDAAPALPLLGAGPALLPERLPGEPGPTNRGPPPSGPHGRAQGQKPGTGTGAGPRTEFSGPAGAGSAAEPPSPPRRCTPFPRRPQTPARAAPPSILLSPASHLDPPVSLGPRTLSSHRRRPPAPLCPSWDPSRTLLSRPGEQPPVPGGRQTTSGPE